MNERVRDTQELALDTPESNETQAFRTSNKHQMHINSHSKTDAVPDK